MERDIYPKTPETRNSEAITLSSAVVEGVLGWNEMWNIRKKLYHQDNIAHLDGVWYRGTYYHKGVAQRAK